MTLPPCICLYCLQCDSICIDLQLCVYAAYGNVYANVCVLYEHALPLSTALWPDHHEGLPVLRSEPWGETVQTSLHVWSLNNRQCVCVRELFQCETLRTAKCVGC